MNQGVEDYLAAIAVSTIAAYDALGLDPEDMPDPLPPPSARVYKGTSDDITEPEGISVLVLADDLEGVVGPLRLGKIKVVVSSPAMEGEREAHAALAKAIAAPFDAALPSTTSLGISGFNCNGIPNVTNNKTGFSEARWVTTIEATLGIVLG